jgi:ferredoxin
MEQQSWIRVSGSGSQGVVSTLLSLIEGPFLQVAFIIFVAGILLRFLFFIAASLKCVAPVSGGGNLKVFFITIGRALFPFHKAVIKKPFYAITRYVFHLCLIAVPIWLSGHDYLWEELEFEWTWDPMPERWADGMTLLLLGICIVLFFRRIIFREVRQNSSASDFILLLIVAMPFLTGYFVTHETLEGVPFFNDYLWPMHLFSGEVMLLTPVFLFCRTRIHREKCVGCAACEVNCPTGTIESNDTPGERVFRYSHYQCICCGSCVDVCAENAAELRHDLGFIYFFQIFSKKEMRRVDLAVCDHCGVSYAPEIQLAKIGYRIAEKGVEHDLLGYCSRCKKMLPRWRLREHVQGEM